MSETVLVALIVAVPPTLTAFLAFLRAGHVAAQTREIADKAEIIHVAVNSNLAAVKADLVIANQRIGDLVKANEALMKELGVK